MAHRPSTEAIAALKEIVGARGFIENPQDQAPYLTEWRDLYQGRCPLVLRPKTVDEVARIVTLCRAEKIGLVPQGGNTGLVGGQIPSTDGSELVLSLNRMDQIRSIDAASDTMVVEAGVTVARAQEAARDKDRLFALSLASEGSCQIGGVISTNAGGTNVLRYGNMRDQVLGLEVVLPDGRVWHGLNALRKDNTGYDLKHLFIGAEGTLGVVTAAVVKLFPLPANQATAFIGLASPGHAVKLLPFVRARCGDLVSGFELMSRFAVEGVLDHIPQSEDPLAERHPWYVLLELSAGRGMPDPSIMLEECLASAYEQGLIADTVIAQNERQRLAFWHVRESMSEAQKHMGASIKHDVSVPISAVPAFIDEANRAVEQACPGIRPCPFGHLGDGNMHYNLTQPADMTGKEFIAQWPAINRVVHDIVHAKGGSISAEHGLGKLKREENKRYKDPTALQLMGEIKTLLDPDNLMNPGKVV